MCCSPLYCVVLSWPVMYITCCFANQTHDLCSFVLSYKRVLCGSELDPAKIQRVDKCILVIFKICERKLNV